MANENKLGIMPINKLIWNMSLPIIASMLVQALYNVVDSFYVSMVNEEALTAVSLAFSAQWIIIAFATGTGVGVNALLSRNLGAHDYEKVDIIAAHGEFLAVCMGIIVGLIGPLIARPYFLAQTKVESIVNYGVDYLSVVCICSFAVYMQIINERLLQATGKSKYSMYTQMLGAIVNIILDPIFILPQVKIGPIVIQGLNMATKGAAIATVFGQLLATLLALYFNLTVNAEIHLTMKHFRPNFKMIGQIYGIAAPSILMMAVGSVMTFFFNKILILYHTAHETAAAAFGIYFKLNSFIFMPVNGLNNGVVPIIGYNYGAGHRSRVTKAIKLSVTYAFAMMVLGIAIIECIPATLISIFHASDELIAVGVPCLRIIAISFSFAGVCIALGSAMQALGKAVYSMITSIVRQLVFLLPAAYILARIGANSGNSNLVWWSYNIAEIASLALSVFFYYRTYKTLILKIPDNSQEK